MKCKEFEKYELEDELDLEVDEMEFNDILNILDGVITDLNKKIISGRIKNSRNEELRIKQIRTLGYICKTFAEIKEAGKVEKLEKELKMLKVALSNGGE